MSSVELTAISGADLLGRHLAAEQEVRVGGPLVADNRLTLLKDGPATYAAMHAAIRDATDHINLQTYLIEDDEVGRRFADHLLEKCASGVEVNLIYDSVGALLTPDAFFDRLREGGARVVEFNPINPLVIGKRIWRFNHRDHRKLLVVDGRIAFVGGINISEVYASGSARPSGWRDTHLEVEGPAVAEFQKLFMDTWRRQHGEPLTAGVYFPGLEALGTETVRAIGSRAGEERESAIYRSLLATLNSAQGHAYLTVAYFAPDRCLLDALTGAAARGVDVRMILPETSDSWPIFHVGRSYYSHLLRRGVRIFERKGSVMHAKTAVIDGVWSTVGSTNLDWRSLFYNDELNAVVIGREFAAKMESMFAEDEACSTEITRAQWRRRPLPLRGFEWLARLVERIL